MTPDILLISSDHPPMQGGIARVMKYLCRVVGETRLRVLAPCHSEAVPESYVIRLPLDRKEPSYKKFFRILLWSHAAQEEIRRYSIKQIIIGVLPPMGVLGLLLRYSTGTPYFIFAHASEIPTQKDSPWRRFLAKSIYEHSAQVLCVSHYAMNRVKAIASQANCSIISHGVDIHRFQRKNKNPELISRYGLQNKKVFLCLGRLVQRKGYDRAIEAFEKVLVKHSHAVLIIAGDGPDRKFLGALAERLGISHAVRFVGFVKEDELADIYNLADIFLFLSREEHGDAEGFGLVILEAFACGCAVIGGRSGAIPEVIQEGRTGLLADPHNSNEIAEKMAQLFNDESFRKNLADNGYAYAQSQSWEAFGRRLLQILDQSKEPAVPC